MTQIYKTVSVCTVKDLDSWSVAAPNIIKHIDSFKYEVVVPDKEVEIFKKRTPSRITVIPESTYLETYNLEWFKSKMPEPLHRRAGWYLQQIIKIKSVQEGPDEAVNLIWDADTVPLKNLCFINKAGKIMYYEGRDRPAFHEHYFETNKKLTGADRKSPHSFISQSFPVKACWARSYCDFIGKNCGTNWINAIMSNIDHSKGGCGFSEYEAMGNYIIDNWESAIEFIRPKYFRHGSRLIGNPVNLYNHEWYSLQNDLDYIAFESYDLGPPWYTGLNIGCGNRRLDKTINNNLFLNTDIEYSMWTDLELDATKPFPFPNNFFEHVVANNVLEHVHNLIDIVSEIDRCLAVGGILQIEVPFIGSYNHGTDVTHIKGFTFDAFNFLFSDSRNYLHRDEGKRPFNYKLINFFREVIRDDALERESLDYIPSRGTYADWIAQVRSFTIPGSFGYAFQKQS